MEEFKHPTLYSNWSPSYCILDGEPLKDGELVDFKTPDGTILHGITIRLKPFTGPVSDWGAITMVTVNRPYIEILHLGIVFEREIKVTDLIRRSSHNELRER